MAIVVQDSSTTRRRTALLAVAAVVVVSLIAGFAFVNSANMSRLAADARSLHWTDTVAGTASLAAAQGSYAAKMAEAQGGGVTPDDVSSSIDELEATHGALVAIGQVGVDHPAYPALARFTSRVEALIADLRSGDMAGETLGTQVQPDFAELSSALAEERSILDRSLDGTGGIDDWIEFLLVLAIPVCVAIACYLTARRWVGAVETRAGRDLAEEHEARSAKDALIANLSHQLRTPLTSVYGFADLLSRGEVRGSEASSETAQMIVTEALEMIRIVDDLMVASQLDSEGLQIELAPTRVGEVVEAAVTPFSRAGLTVDREPTAAMALADPDLLQHVLTNLLSNAVVHGGPEIGVEVTVGEGRIDIEIADNGRGVPEDRLDALLSTLSGTASAPLLAGGSGLGLTVASRLTELIGGRIRYQRYGGRTYFVVTVPADGGVADSGDPSDSVAEMIRALSS